MSIITSVSLHGRSGGCHACRRMKVRCDREIPECSRCRRAGRTCPGYRSEVDNFISMNDSTKQKAQIKAQRISSRETSPIVKENTTPGLPNLEIENSTFNTLGPPTQPFQMLIPVRSDARKLSVTSTWEKQAIDGFLKSFGSNSNPAVAWVDFLPEIYDDELEGSSFGDALKAVSFMHFSQRTCMTSFIAQARKYYGQALMQVSAELNVQVQHTDDHLLATLALLDLYEIMTGDKPLTLAWDTHSAGQAMLIQARGQTPTQSQSGRSVYRAISNFVCIKDLSQKRRPVILQRSPTENDHGTIQITEATSLLVRIAFLQSQSRALVEEARKGSVDHAKIFLLLRDSIAVERSCESWKDNCPSAWQPQNSPYQRSLPPTPPGYNSISSYPKEIRHFVDTSMASLWCTIEAARIRLLQGMIECTDILGMPAIQDTAAFSRTTLTKQINDSIDVISSITPHLLGEINSSGDLCLPPIPQPRSCIQALWPLHVCALVREIDDSYFDWLVAQLHRAGEVVGCRRSIELEQYRARRYANHNQIVSSNGMGL